jgi:hypothetical protein
MPEFESQPAKTAMDAVKALLWIPDAAAKIALLFAVVFIGWQCWVLHSKVIALENVATRISQQREAEMALLKELGDEIRLYRQAVIAKSGRLLNPDEGGTR